MLNRRGAPGLAIFVLLAAGLTGLTGCSEEMDQAKQAANAASALMEVARQAEKTGAAMEAAQAAAAEEARKQIPEGATPEQAEQQIQMAKTLAAMQAMQQAGGGPVVNWRQLAPYLPEKFEGYEARGELDGRTTSTGGMQFTEVKRRYKQGDKKLRIQITDTSMAGMLRAPFAMAAMINEDSTRGYKKGTKLDGHSAIVEWESKRKRSKATALVGERFVVSIRVDGTESDEEAQRLLKALPLNEIAKLRAKPEQ